MKTSSETFKGICFVFELILINFVIYYQNIYRGSVNWSFLIYFTSHFVKKGGGDILEKRIVGAARRMDQPTSFSTKWYSHKFRGLGVRNEIGINIRTENMVWTHGGYQCDEYPDLKLTREAYTHTVGETRRINDMWTNDGALYFTQKERYFSKSLTQNAIYRNKSQWSVSVSWLSWKFS